jgi:hypothetical protein
MRKVDAAGQTGHCIQTLTKPLGDEKNRALALKMEHQRRRHEDAI